MSDASSDSPVWRVTGYRVREGEARFTDNLDRLNGVEVRELKGGALRWGWREVREDGEPLYQAVCEVIAGPALYLLTAACTGPEGLGQIAQTIGGISIVTNTARRETVQTQKE